MPMITVRTTKGTGGDWQPLPKATYDFTVTDVKEKTASSGNPNLQVACSVADGQYTGRTANIWYSLLPKSGWKLKMLLEACGVDFNEVELDGEIDEDSGKPLTELQFDTDEIVGKTFTCDVTEGEFEGKANNRFNNERPVGMTLPELKAKNAERRKQAEAEESAPAPAAQSKPQGNQQRQAAPQGQKPPQSNQGQQRQPGNPGPRRVQG